MALPTPRPDDSFVSTLLTRNTTYSHTHTKPPTYKSLFTAPSPTPKTVIITCSDSRTIPETFLSLSTGDALVIRNAGGRANNPATIKDLVVFDQILPGGVGNVLLVQHEDCGMTNRTDKEIRAGVEKRLEERGAGGKELLPGTFGEIGDLDETVKKDVRFLRELPFWTEGVVIRGFVWMMMGDGRLREVECA